MHTEPPSSPPPAPEAGVNAESARPSERSEHTSTEATDSLIGVTLLDTYTIDRVLGEGGMGRIYEARHTRVKDKRFAIKVLRPELVDSIASRARFEREMEAVARV